MQQLKVSFILYIIATVVWLLLDSSIAFQSFLVQLKSTQPASRRTTRKSNGYVGRTTTTSCTATAYVSQLSLLLATTNPTIYYSPNFHRHIVVDKDKKTQEKTISSFIWLDEAIASNKEAQFLPLSMASTDRVSTIAGGATLEDTAYKQKNESENNNDNTTYNTTIIEHINCLQYKEIREKYISVIRKLSDSRFDNGKDSLPSFFKRFPKADRQWIEERLLFFLAPFRQKISKKKNENSHTDWPKQLSNGYGVGLSIEQTLLLIQFLPHFLTIHPEQLHVNKPSVAALYVDLGVPFQLVDEANVELEYWLKGSSMVDAASFAFLRSIDVSWDQCRTMLDAFSLTLVSCDLEPSVEMVQKGPVRNRLVEERLIFLRMRLHFSPYDILAIHTTHPRLSLYGLDNLKQKLDLLQDKLSLQSHQLRNIVLNVPSFLGVSVEKVEERITFLTKEVRMTTPQAQKAIIYRPSLLKYRVDTYLRPKLEFLKQDLQIPTDKIPYILSTCPFIFARSTERKLTPIFDGFTKSFGFSPDEVGAMVSKVPNILACNWQLNLQPKLQFIQQRLNLVPNDRLRQFITSIPRLLLQSTDNSIGPKIDMVEEATGKDLSLTIQIIETNPSLLLRAKESIKKKCTEYVNGSEPWNKVFNPRGRPLPGVAVKNGDNNDVDKYNYEKKKSINGMSMTLLRESTTATAKEIRAKRKGQMVIELDKTTGETIRRFQSVKEAAMMLETSTANVYRIIRTARSFKGYNYQYAFEKITASINDTKDTSKSTKQPQQEQQQSQGNLLFVQDLQRNFMRDDDNIQLFEALQSGSMSQAPRSNHDNDNYNKSSYLCAFVSGRAFPPRSSPLFVQGGNRDGGMAIYLPQLQGPFGGKMLRQATESCFFHHIMPNAENGTKYCDGLVLLGYPYLQPSHHRCALYACLEVLKLVHELIAQQAAKEKQEQPQQENIITVIEIDIFTDSSYVLDLLQNSTQLLQWGEIEQVQDFKYNGPGMEFAANSDILYPVAKTFYKIVCQQLPKIENSFQQQGQKTISSKQGQLLAKEIQINFRHVSELSIINDSAICFRDKQRQQIKSLGDLALKAASWQYKQQPQKILL